MTGIDGGQAVEVNIGDCLCPGDPRPHPDGDVVLMRAKPDLAMGLAAEAAIRQSDSFMGDTEAAVYSVFVRYGVVSWNIRDDKGPRRVTFEAILDRLQWNTGGAIVAKRGRDLYYEAVLAPLVPPSSPPRPPTRTNGSTHPKPRSGPNSPTSPRRSSRSGAVASR